MKDIGTWPDFDLTKEGYVCDKGRWVRVVSSQPADSSKLTDEASRKITAVEQNQTKFDEMKVHFDAIRPEYGDDVLTALSVAEQHLPTTDQMTYATESDEVRFTLRRMDYGNSILRVIFHDLIPAVAYNDPEVTSVQAAVMGIINGHSGTEVRVFAEKMQAMRNPQPAA
jgi:hypothetical protein